MHIKVTAEMIERAKIAEKYYTDAGQTIPKSVALVANAYPGETVDLPEDE